MKDSFYILNQLVNNFKNTDGIVVYSVFQMPFDNKERKKYLINLKRKTNILCP